MIALVSLRSGVNRATVAVGLCLWLALAVSVTKSAEPPGYYDSARALTGPALRGALHTILRSSHTVVPFDSGTETDTLDALMVLNEGLANPSQVVLLYANRPEAKTNYPALWNREHLWPESYGTADGAANSDLFNLAPEDSRVNSSRGNKYFDQSDPADRLFRSPAHANAPLCSTDSNSWEPPAGVKGDIARALFYLDVRYEGEEREPDLALTDFVGDIGTGRFLMGRLTTLIRWHVEDPVDGGEQKRNELVFERYQHNRNPFVDRPEWVQAVFGPELSIWRGPSNVVIAWESRWVDAVLESADLPAP